MATTDDNAVSSYNDDAMRRKVLVAAELARHGRQYLSQLEEAGLHVVERFDLDGTASERELIEGLEDAWAVVAGGELYSERVLKDLPQLRAIARTGAGFDRIDVAAATARGVAVITTPGANAGAVADLTVLLMLACLRRLGELEELVRQGFWGSGTVGGDLGGATVGVVGLGGIGREVVRRLRGFGCRIVATDPLVDRRFCEAFAVEALPLEALLPQVDILTLHMPLCAETHHLIGAQELANLRPGAVVINTARGGIIDASALLDALKSGRLAGAGLDVCEDEPLATDHPLLSTRNVVITGHRAALTQRAVASTMAAVASSLVALARGCVPAGLQNSEVMDVRRTDARSGPSDPL